MADAAPKKFSAMRYFRDRMIRLVVGVILFFIGLAVYSSYKYFFWSHTQAVAISVEPVCVYAKKDGRRSKVEYLGCGADSESAATGSLPMVTSFNPASKPSSRPNMKLEIGERVMRLSGPGGRA